MATAKEIRQDGIYILPVGVGTGINRALLDQMASDPANVFTVTDYAALSTALDKIVGGACAALEQLTTTPCTSAKVSCGLRPCSQRPWQKGVVHAEILGRFTHLGGSLLLKPKAGIACLDSAIIFLCMHTI